MQTREGTRAFARGLLLFPFLFSCASIEPDPGVAEVEEVVSALHAREREVVLFDDFECGGLADFWSTRGDVEVREDAAHRGELGVQLGERAALVGHFDTRGRAKLRLAFSARALGHDRDEALRVELSVGDHPFHPIAQLQACDWSRHTLALPRYAEGRAEVRVRFVVSADHGFRGYDHERSRWRPRSHGHADASVRVQLDDVVITAAASRTDAGIDAGPSDASAPDAEVGDAGLSDASLVDAQTPDAAVADGAVADADVPDAAAPDAGTCTSDETCNDGNACNGEETCEAGRCAAGMALRCDDGDACTADRCEPASGCVSQPGPGLPCEEDGVCDATGACVACVAPENTFDAIQLRIFDSPKYLCTTCHRTGGRLIDLTAGNAYAVLLGQTGGRPEIIVGIPETSVLYDRLRAKVEGTVPFLGGNPMPRGNAPAITRAELDAIATWIRGGAPRTGLVPGTEAALCVPPPPDH